MLVRVLKLDLNTSTPENDYILHRKEITSDGGIMVSIAAFQAVDPGSIPGRRSYFLLLTFIERGSCDQN